jgi:hypothetical protein
MYVLILIADYGTFSKFNGDIVLEGKIVIARVANGLDDVTAQ